MHTRWQASLAVVGALLSASTASAAGGVVGHRALPASITGARMAVALAPDRTTRWLEVTVSGAEGGFVWLVPAAPGARVDLGSQAWLDALDDASAPTVVAPATPLACDAGPWMQQGTPPPRPPAFAPAGSGVATDAAALVALVTAAGGALSPAALASFEAVFGAGLDVVVLDYDTTTEAATTRAVRVVEPGARGLDIPSTGGGAVSADAVVFVVAGARASVGPVAVTIDPSAIQWTSQGGSTFATVASHVLGADPGDVWLTESALPGRFFAPDGVLRAPLGPSLPTVLDRYFALSALAGDAGALADACALAAAPLATAAAPVDELCPAGALATVPGPSPCAAAAPGSLPAAPLACGASATDAAFALAGLAPASLWLTRAAGLLLADTSTDAAIGATASSPVPAIVTASGYDFTCGAAPDAGAATPSWEPPSPTLSPPVAIDPPTPGVWADETSGTEDGAEDASAEDSATVDSGGCDGSDADAGDDAGGGCSGESAGVDPGCGVPRKKRLPKGVAARVLVLAVAALAVGRRKTRRRVT